MSEDNFYDFDISMLIKHKEMHYCPHCQKTFFEVPRSKGRCWGCDAELRDEWFFFDRP